MTNFKKQITNKFQNTKDQFSKGKQTGKFKELIIDISREIIIIYFFVLSNCSAL